MLLKDGFFRIYIMEKSSRCKLLSSFSILSNSKRESLFKKCKQKRYSYVALGREVAVIRGLIILITRLSTKTSKLGLGNRV